MMTRAATAVAGVCLCGAVLAGCGRTASLPGGHTISVPAVSVPSVSLPEVRRLAGIDLTKNDAVNAKRALCMVTDVWLSADQATKNLIRPTVNKVIGHYQASSDSGTQTLAKAAGLLVGADSDSDAAKRATWRRLCG